MQIEFVKFDGEQFCRLHSGHLRRSVHNAANLHDARNRVSAIQPRKEEDSFAEYEEALLNFELRVRAQDLPFRRPDLLYINPQVEDSHPFPLIVSELTSEHQNNGQLGSTDDTNGEERRVERWTVVTLQAYAETTSHTLRHTAL
ncbi:hypothetical protein T08_1912 [Trichinella sp. T8]|nr:hypothetical protein T08_1912 [Trichinella sp. T8]